jgi:hypothetical protein
MKRLQSSLFAAVGCALTVSVSAQTTALTGGVSKPTFGAGETVTITGCLERSNESVATNDRFVLNNIVPNAPAMAGTAVTSGPERPNVTSYRLAAEDSKLSRHVGHKIEITGTVEDRQMNAAGASGATGSARDAPKFKVETVKMIASSCRV